MYLSWFAAVVAYPCWLQTSTRLLWMFSKVVIGSLHRPQLSLHMITSFSKKEMTSMEVRVLIFILFLTQDTIPNINFFSEIVTKLRPN